MEGLGDTGTVFVTGASGFIGRALCRALTERGVEVRGLARSPAAGPWVSLARIELGRDHLPSALFDGVTTVVHLAGYVHAADDTPVAEDICRRVNVGGTRALLESCAQAGVSRFVYLSSVKAMGEGSPVQLDETASPTPVTPYGRSKLAGEHLVIEHGRVCSMHVAVLRPALVYGAGAKGNISRMLSAVAAGRFPPVCDLGDRRSMVHVEDLVSATLLAASVPAAAGQVYIVTDGRIYSTRELFVAMCRSLGRPVPRWCVPLTLLRLAARTGDLVAGLGVHEVPLTTSVLGKLAESAWYSCAKIERELGYRPGRNLDMGLRDMLAATPGEPSAG